MDFHVLIVIACVFLASLFSLLFINKFFRGKTFEEVAAEKKLLAEKLYGPSKAKKQRKITNKKDVKKDKKQKSKEHVGNKDDADSHNESDVESHSNDNSPSHKKPHVEFSEPEIITNVENVNIQKRSNSSGSINKPPKRKISNTKTPGTGILVNKTEPVVVKETLIAEPLNNFEVKQPKDVLEPKKPPRDDNSENKKEKTANKEQKKNNKEKRDMKKDSEKSVEPVLTQIEEIPIIKEMKKNEDKLNKNHESPKTQVNKPKKKKVETSITEKLDNSDVIGVNGLMALFSRAELNRSEIQMLIDYLLNKQQDTLANHSEWSDDIVQKLRKQLNEKEKALQEEQEASTGIQAKLRDLRTEINTERAQHNAVTKAYLEEIQAKKSEIHNLNQEIQNMTEKINLERQQFQAKLRHEKQASSQELLAQIQQLNERTNILQNEIVQKNTYINELQMIANASHQAVEETKQSLNEIIQQQAGQIHALEQNISEAENKIARQQYDLELAKIVEKDKENSKVEIRNLQNALDSTNAELNLARNEVNENKNKIDILNAEIDKLNKQIVTLNTKYMEQNKESNDLKNLVANYEVNMAEKDKKLMECENSIRSLTSREDELMKQVREQKEKNNDLRTKNWKLVEALQSAETNAVKDNKKHFSNLVHQGNTTSNDEQKIRELFQRLFPEATKTAAGSALTLSFDQWVEQVVAIHIKQTVQKFEQSEQISNNKQGNSEHNNSNHSYQHHLQSTTAESNNHHNSEENSNYNSDSILLQNAQLRAHIEELTAIVTKTENMLTNIETQAREQDAHWRSVVQSKQEEINLLKNSNGQAI